jgi:hypothetical protein
MIEITEKRINALKQLDRIEFRQKKDNIINSHKSSINSVWAGFLIFCFIILIYIFNPVFSFRAYGVFITLCLDFVLLGAICFLYILCIIYTVIKQHKTEKLLTTLEKEYFKIIAK